jgi:hypothetical protein
MTKNPKKFLFTIATSASKTDHRRPGFFIRFRKQHHNPAFASVGSKRSPYQLLAGAGVAPL